MTQDLYVAHGLISVNSSYLLLRRRDGRYLGGQWDIPGGTVEDGESPNDAVVRECLEETGRVVTCGELVTHYTNDDTEGRDIIFHTLTYGLNLKEGNDSNEIKISKDEHDDTRWLSIGQALDSPLVWHVRQTLVFVRLNGWNPTLESDHKFVT